MTNKKVTHYLDVSGHKCPLPIMRLRRLIGKIKNGEFVELKATDPMTLIDVPNYCRETGHEVVNVTEVNNYILYLVKKC